MTTLDVPCDGRATFHRLGVRGLRDFLLGAESAVPTASAGFVAASWTPVIGSRYTPEVFAEPNQEAVQTFLRPVAYLARGIGT